MVAVPSINLNAKNATAWLWANCGEALTETVDRCLSLLTNAEAFYEPYIKTVIWKVNPREC